MVKKIYWTSIEYLVENNSNTRGGMVYAFAQAIDARDAIEKFIEKLHEEKKNSSILEVEFVSPYDFDIEWESEKEKSLYDSLYHRAINNEEVIFDVFYDYGFEE